MEQQDLTGTRPRQAWLALWTTGIRWNERWVAGAAASIEAYRELKRCSGLPGPERVKAWAHFRDAHYGPDDGPRLCGVDLEGLSASGFDLQRVDLRGALLQKADLRSAQLGRAKLFRAHLQEADLGLAQLNGAVLSGAHLQGANLQSAELANAMLLGASLENADLRAARLEEARLSGTLLQGANLWLSRLQKAGLQKAQLQGVNLGRAQLQKANLSGAGLEGADLMSAQLQAASLHGARLQGADLKDAQLQGADLQGAQLQGADLWDAHLQGADLRLARLEGARLTDADLTNVDLRGARGFLFDATIVRNAKLSPRRSDPWTRLQRRYTGTKMVLNLVLLIAFFVALIIKATYWHGVYLGRQSLQDLADQQTRAFTQTFQTSLDEVLAQPSSYLLQHPVEYSQALIVRHLQARVESFTATGADRPVWQALLWGSGGWPQQTLAVALVFYNILRFWMTLSVAYMNSEQERSGLTPPHRPRQATIHDRRPLTRVLWGKVAEHVRRIASSAPEYYGSLWYPDRAITVLEWIALVAFIVQARAWLSTPVWLPY